MKIALDAGHGAGRVCPSTGAAANGLIEDVLTLDLSRRIGHHLRAMGLFTLYTRPDKRLVSLSSRARLACRSSCGLFLSLHCNAGPASASGVEAFVVDGDNCSKRVARTLVGAMARLDMRSRGVKPDTRSGPGRLAVLRGTYRAMPSVLLEIGFLTNATDAALLADPTWRERASIALAEQVGGWELRVRGDGD